jgi:hypothetical protein
MEKKKKKEAEIIRRRGMRRIKLFSLFTLRCVRMKNNPKLKRVKLKEKTNEGSFRNISISFELKLAINYFGSGGRNVGPLRKLLIHQLTY